MPIGPEQQGGTAINDAVTYTTANATIGSRVLASKMAELAGIVNSELARRGNAARAVQTVYTDGNILARHLNLMQGNLSTGSYPYSAGFTNVAVDGIVYAANINAMIQKVKTAGAVCLCNCNYCTCNCNYCTCNCNYACTCNCNYSDQRLKDNVEFLRTEGDLNVYSYTYKWNKDKKYIGVIAQELLGTKYESALGTDRGGYYFVDYSQLPVNMIEG
jgi:hypothetical protein